MESPAQGRGDSRPQPAHLKRTANEFVQYSKTHLDNTNQSVYVHVVLGCTTLPSVHVALGKRHGDLVEAVEPRVREYSAGLRDGVTDFDGVGPHFI